mgnify:FL=1
MLTDREKALIDMLKTLAEELRDYPETGVISSDVYASTAYDVAGMASESDVDGAIEYHVKVLNSFKSK